MRSATASAAIRLIEAEKSFAADTAVVSSAVLSGVSTVEAFDATTTARSSDQIVADAIAGDTAFRTLNYRTQALFYNLGGGLDVPDNRDTLSFEERNGRVRFRGYNRLPARLA